MTTGVLRLTKHHGLGNDFLVLLDPVAGLDGAALARRLCDRRRGIGADGLLIAHPGTDGADVTMELRNADGSRAEMSGNGIRCFVQAVVGAGLAAPGPMAVATDAGVRVVDYRESGEAGLAHASVEMGPAALGDELDVGDVPGARAARSVDMGNPHVVVFGEPVDTVTVRTIGPRLSARLAQGANVEFVWPGPEPGDLTLRVWERGVGETLACGTGACATAAAAQAWGHTGRRTRVHSPGGTLEVTVDERSIVLAGPTRRVAGVSVSEADLAALVRAMADGDPRGADREVSARP
jgi:diaminopimelate epimerase